MNADNTALFSQICRKSNPFLSDPTAMQIRFLLLLLCCAFFANATPAPDFTVTSSDGVVRKLYQDYVNQNKILVIEAFFTTCPPCAAHAAAMQTLYQNMLAAHPGQLDFLLLSTLSSDSNVKVAAYKTAKSLTMPAVGANGNSQTALQPYTSGQFGQFLGTPTFIVIAPGTGEVHFDIRGGSVAETISLLQAKIESLLPYKCGLSTWSGLPIQGVKLHIQAPGFDTLIPAQVPGAYGLDKIPALQNSTYTIQPIKTDSVLKGVSTYDLLQISKHILSIQALTEPWQLYAADANCSGTITNFDIIVIRKVLLGITDTFSCSSWRFFPDGTNMAQQGACVGFKGVKIGDVTGPQFQDPNPEDRAPLRIRAQDMLLEAGKTYQWAFQLEESVDLAGFQMQWNTKGIQVTNLESSLLPGFTDENYAFGDKNARISWHSAQELNLGAAAPLCILTFTAQTNDWLSNHLELEQYAMAAELYQGASRQSIELNWVKNLPSQDLLILPNPTFGAFELIFEAAATSEQLLQVVDINGRIVYEQVFYCQKGYNRPSFETKVKTPGLYFLKLTDRPTNKIIFAAH